MNILAKVRSQYPPYKKWELLSQLALSHYTATGDRQSFARHRRAKRKSEDMSLDMARNQARMFSARTGGE